MTAYSSVARKYLIALSILAFGFIGFASITLAQGPAGITFPVAELGNCAGEEDCRAYCDDLANVNRCIDFAEKNGLMSGEEVERARAVGSIQDEGGPGGCTSHGSCEAYCSDIRNVDECLAFAEERGMLPPEELEEFRKFATAIRGGATPPGNCSSKEECEAYCENPGNIDECIAFAEEAGFLPPEELEEMRRVAPLIRDGQTPGGCSSKEECEAYCEDDANRDECVEFGIKAGFVSPQDAEHMRERGNHPDVSDAPPEVARCIRNLLGDREPGEGDGERVRECFERFHEEQEDEHRDGFRRDQEGGVPPRGAGPCGEIPDELREQLARGEVDRAEVEAQMRECADAQRETFDESRGEFQSEHLPTNFPEDDSFPPDAQPFPPGSDRRFDEFREHNEAFKREFENRQDFNPEEAEKFRREFESRNDADNHSFEEHREEFEGEHRDAPPEGFDGRHNSSQPQEQHEQMPRDGGGSVSLSNRSFIANVVTAVRFLFDF